MEQLQHGVRFTSGVERDKMLATRLKEIRQNPGHVYFLHAPEQCLVKIGYTKGDPFKRTAEIQCMSPVPLTLIGVMLGSRMLESLLHSEFADQRKHGEWFSDAVLEPLRQRMLDVCE